MLPRPEAKRAEEAEVNYLIEETTVMAPFRDVAIFVLATYGLAWLWTQSTLFGPIRRWIQSIPESVGLFSMSDGLECLICAGTWIAIGIFLLRIHLGVFSPWFTGAPLLSLPLFIGLWVAAGWTLGRFNGELREE